MKRTFLTFAALFVAVPLLAQKPIIYKISFENAAHHEAEISVQFSDVPEGKLELRMSRSSPGRYALHEFAKNVYNVRAVDSKGKPLIVSRPNPYQWDVSGHSGTVKVSYTLYADHADGTYAAVDASHAHLNMPATFMWARGMDERKIRIEFSPPRDSNWKVATQLAPTNDPFMFTAPNFQYFMDSPTELSNFMLREWPVDSPHGEQTIRIALHHEGTEAEADVYAEMGKRVVDEQIAIFGELPKLDYGTYTFIADYLPWVSGDGMEHRNSTILIGTNPLKTRAVGNLGTLSHEFVHTWNVERIRPKSLEPFNFEAANMSGELWFAEGFTSYYTPLTIHRAGLTSLDRLARSYSGTLNYVLNSPGRNFFSAVEMSMQAPFVDAARAVDEHNRNNTFISYYSFGAAIGLGLDLALRSKFEGLSLDNLMQAMWQNFGRSETPYTNENIRETLAEITGDQAFATMFFDKYIFGNEVLNYKSLLANAGLTLKKRNPGKAWAGAAFLRYQDGKALVSGATRIGSPFYNAGVDRDDKIIEIDGMEMSSQDEFKKLLDSHEPGDVVEISYWQRGQEKTEKLTFAEDPSLQVVPFEHQEQEITQEIAAFRKSWLGSKAKNQRPELVKHCHRCKREFAFAFEYCRFDGETLMITSDK